MDFFVCLGSGMWKEGKENRNFRKTMCMRMRKLWDLVIVITLIELSNI